MILCNRNREQVLEVTQQQLIIFPLIIARCAEATLRVLLCQTGMCCNQRGRDQVEVPAHGAWGRKCSTRRHSSELNILPRPRLFRSYQTLQKGQHRVKRHHVRSLVRPSSDKKCCAKRLLLMLCTVLRRRMRLHRSVRRFTDYLLGKEEV